MEKLVVFLPKLERGITTFNIIGNDRTKFGELNGEFYLINENKKWFAYDYVDMIMLI